MLAVEICFKPRVGTRGDEFEQFDGQLDMLLSGLIREDNLLDHVTIETEDLVRIFGVAPAQEALELTHWNTYARQSWVKLEELSERVATIEIVGVARHEDSICECKAPQRYLLFTTYLSDFTARCGDCDGAVPLYRLPHLDKEEEHWTLSSWNRTYTDLDRLFMASYIGERYCYQQLHEPTSELAQWSRKLAEQLQEKTGTPFIPF